MFHLLFTLFTLDYSFLGNKEHILEHFVLDILILLRTNNKVN